MTLTARLTELGAVNQMLISIGEAPVTSLSSTLGDVAIAYTTLLNVSREIQAQGWQVNTNYNVVMTPDSGNDDEIRVDDDVLSITTDDLFRNPASAVHGSKELTASIRLKTGETYYALWDVVNNTFAWSNVDQINVTEIRYYPFDNLTPLLQVYIFTEAAHRFQTGQIGSTVYYKYTKEMVENAMVAAEAEAAANERNNLLTDNAGVAAGAARYNPLWGT